jgi:hypothetical protein
LYEVDYRIYHRPRATGQTASRIDLELVLDAVAQTEPVSVLTGVTIKWSATAKARHIALVLTSGADGKWVSRAIAQDVIVSVGAVGVDELIFGTSWAFIRLLSSANPVSDYRIEHRIAQLKA